MVKNPLSYSEANYVRQMAHTEGWKIIARELRERFNREYKKLRTCNRDNTFWKAQGYLNVIEEIFNMVEQKMSDIEEGE